MFAVSIWGHIVVFVRHMGDACVFCMKHNVCLETRPMCDVESTRADILLHFYNNRDGDCVAHSSLSLSIYTIHWGSKHQLCTSGT